MAQYKFRKGERLTAEALNKALAAIVAESQQAVSEGDSAAARQAGGGTVAPLPRAYTPQKLPDFNTLAPFRPLLSLPKNGLIAPGSVGWFYLDPEAEHMQPLATCSAAPPNVGQYLYLKWTWDFTHMAPYSPTLSTCRPKWAYPECGNPGVMSVSLGHFAKAPLPPRTSQVAGDDLVFIPAAPTAPVLFTPAVLSYNQSEQESGLHPVPLHAVLTEPVGYISSLTTPELNMLPLRSLTPLGVARAFVRPENSCQVFFAGGVAFAPHDSVKDVTEGSCFCKYPSGACELSPEWTALAKFLYGDTEIVLEGFPRRPDLWALRFSPGSVIVSAPAPPWVRFSPDGSTLPEPGDEICGTHWVLTLFQGRVLTATCDNWDGWAEDVELYDYRTLVAPGKNTETGCSWVWFSRQRRRRGVNGGQPDNWEEQLNDVN